MNNASLSMIFQFFNSSINKNYEESMDAKLADILIAEDENIIALDIKLTLEKLGYKVISVVSNGEDALKEVQRKMPDLVLMDIQLNGLKTGIETAEEIFLLYGTPIVYLTALSDNETLDRAKRTQPFGYVHKPFDQLTLQLVIESAIKKHAAESELKKNSQQSKGGKIIPKNLLRELTPSPIIFN